MAKNKKKRQGALPPDRSFSVDADEVMAVLRVRSQFDKELRIHIEAAQWEAVATQENQQRLDLETKLLKMEKEREEEE